MAGKPNLEELRRRFDEAPYPRLLGLRLLELQEGYARVAVSLRPEFANFAGLVHGGLLMSLADQAFGCALNTLDRLYVATQFNIHILGGARLDETLEAEGRIVHAGRTTGLGQMSVRTASGRLVALATGAVVALQKEE
ncbi:MAG: PaaI family thioesterase [Chloroflexi bacterium]|nr:PaaI family thioesterase [Chloroflexota bacterium]MCL5109843.1 PaaI family thioesterase [Chloroflexota bacterium]